MTVDASRLAEALRETGAAFAKTIPVILGVLALVSLSTAAVPPQRLVEALPLQGVLGPILGAAVGSVAAGHPATSYVIAGELRAAGADLATVTALVVSWVTVGIVHLPAEASVLGIRFALWRNGVSFCLAIAMAYAVAALFQSGP